MGGRFSSWVIKGMSGLVLAFLYAPLVIVIVYAFNRSVDASWPPDLWTTHWFTVAWHDDTVAAALRNSVIAGLGATGIALVLGSFASFALARFRFFGRDAISFALVLPIALPGIVTALALKGAIEYGQQTVGLEYSLFTIIIGHATFCVVVVFNNVVARLRRSSTSLTEASMDLGADGWQTFRHITFPSIKTALVAGGLLAFGLSFDEIVVTLFTSGTQTTLPIWIFGKIQRPTEGPIVNVVAMLVMLASLVPIYFAQRLAGRDATGAAAGRAGVSTAMEEAGPG
jgi:putative spermidine/putrescine transport system permease protein